MVNELNCETGKKKFLLKARISGENITSKEGFTFNFSNLFSTIGYTTIYTSGSQPAGDLGYQGGNESSKGGK